METVYLLKIHMYLPLAYISDAMSNFIKMVYSLAITKCLILWIYLQTFLLLGHIEDGICFHGEFESYYLGGRIRSLIGNSTRNLSFNTEYDKSLK